MSLFSPLKFLLLLIFSNGLSLSLSQAQEKQIIRLNEHFYPINENDSVNYYYKAIIVNFTDSTSVERVFNRKNQIVKITRYGYNLDGHFPEENIEIYDSNFKLSTKKIKNRNNGFYQAIYYRDGELVGDVLYLGQQKYEIRKSGSEEVVTAEENAFEPKPDIDQDLWNETLKNHLSYPTTARRNKEEGIVILAIYVNEFGERTEPIIANPENVSESLALEAIRAASKFDGEIIPATTIDGQTRDAWLYIPLRFKLD